MKKTVIYLAVAFGAAWVIWGGMAFIPAMGSMGWLSTLTMWMPALGVLAAWLLTKREPILKAGFRPRFRGHIRYYLAALLLPALLTIIGGGIYFLVFPSQFDTGLTLLRAQTAQTPGADVLGEAAVVIVLLSQLFAGIVIGPLINTVFALGEEIGWRGYLFPALEAKMSRPAAILASGVIWGVWHTPINAMGHNYGVGYWGYPWIGIVAMCVFCIGVGALLSWLTVRTGSIWPAALGHGAINAVGGLMTLFIRGDAASYAPLGPAVSGILPSLPFVVLGVILLLRAPRQAEATPHE